MGRVENKVVVVECEVCHKKFERSHFNPYMTKCPVCRKSKKAISLRSVEGAVKRLDEGARVVSQAFAPATSKRNKCCMQFLAETEKLGMLWCPKCEKQWYAFEEGWAKKWGTQMVYYKGKFVGVQMDYSSLRAIMMQVEESL